LDFLFLASRLSWNKFLFFVSFEQEWIMHTGSSKADIDFAKRIMPEKSIVVDNVGRISEFSVSDVEKMADADPGVKSSGEITNVKVHFYGSDTAIATYKSHFVQTGHKDSKFDLDLNSASLDVWKKMNGQWKVVGGTYTSIKPLPAEMYQMALPPGAPPIS
jgi:hypothetical protein